MHFNQELKEIALKHRRICSSCQNLQTQEMNIKMANIIGDIPSCCTSLGTRVRIPGWVGAHSPWNTGSHTLPKRMSSCHKPRAGTAWKLAPLMLKPVGFQVLVSHSKVPSLPPGIQLHTALGFPSSHWWQTQSSSVGSHSETAAPGSSPKKQLRAKMLLPLFPRKVPEAKTGLPGTQFLSSCLCLGRHTWSCRCKRQEVAVVEGLKINRT